MKNKNLWMVWLPSMAIGLLCLIPELSFAQVIGGGGDFQNKMGSLQNSLLHDILPILATLGLTYSAFLAYAGDASAKPKMILIGGASIAAFVGPSIIQFLKSVLG